MNWMTRQALGRWVVKLGIVKQKQGRHVLISDTDLRKIQRLRLKPGNVNKTETEPSNGRPVSISENLEMIRILQSQLETKDKQISEKDKQILELSERVKESHILLKTEQEKTLLLLESPPEKPSPVQGLLPGILKVFRGGRKE